MAPSIKKCDDDETTSFCLAFGSFGFFLTSTFPALKHHQPCTLLQSAWQLQLSIGAFGKTKLQKLLDPTSLYESIFCKDVDSHVFAVCFSEESPFFHPNLCPKKVWKTSRKSKPVLRRCLLEGYLVTLRILTPPMETPDPPNDTPGASKQVVLTPHDIPRILRAQKSGSEFSKE